MDTIQVKGAQEHNLKNVDLTIPRDKMVVFSGVSGSGKTTLAFDTIYAEGQRRYMESLSSYARQFLGNTQKPKVESIEGLSPAISIEQKTTNKNPRSTVGTVTEIYDYFRLLYARIGIPHCPNCGREITSQSIDQIIDKILAHPEGTKFQILAPIVRSEKGEFKRLFERLRKDGYARVIVDGQLYDLSENIRLKKTFKHTISVVIDRLKIKDGIRKRLTDSVEAALRLADGLVECDIIGGETELFSENLSCPDCNINMPVLEPRSFSFNNPFGMCPDCNGLGFHKSVDPRLVYPDPEMSIDEGGIKFASNRYDYGYFDDAVHDIAHHYNFSVYEPLKNAPEGLVDDILFGTDYDAGRDGIWEGSVNRMNRRYHSTDYPNIRDRIEKYMKDSVCPTCGGKRLNPNALAVTVGGRNIIELTDMSVTALGDFFDELRLTPTQAHIADMLLQEIKVRLKFLSDVGLDYLTLSRSAATLSGGESQRIKLSSQLSSKLMGVLYVLDEPSIGLHQRDNAKLLNTLRDLTQLGNTLIIVEHDEETLEAADYLVDVGPGAGEHGGEIVAAGSLEEIKACPESLTGQYLAGKKFIPVPEERRSGNGDKIVIKGAKTNNLKNITAEFPLGEFISVIGVSGSGKSSLVNEILFKGLAQKLYHGTSYEPGEHKAMEGIEHIDKVIAIDQSPIGRTPRSNPATYTKVFDIIRDLFAATPEAKVRGYNKGRFSFNVKGGRCEACKGDGIKTIEMNFLPDVEVPCEVCGGARYNRETLEVKYKGKSISEVLDMTIEEAHEFFKNLPRIEKILQTLLDVGLGYVRLGQPSTQLSGGEAQRVKLASELCKINTGRTMYILDEPTTGLHMDDVNRLIQVLQRLVDQGSTVVVIEHNIDLIKSADWLIEMGPEGGDAGGQVIGTGTPEQIAETKNSPTGPYLKKALAEKRG